MFEFKLEAVRRVKADQSIAPVAATLDVPAPSISNRAKAEQDGKPGGAGVKPIWLIGSSSSCAAACCTIAQVPPLYAAGQTRVQRTVPMRGRLTNM
ncbi:hypothetical protein [Cupriavidus basilensis]